MLAAFDSPSDDIEFTPGGVDNNKSGTTGEGEVIELKLERFVDDEQDDGDGTADEALPCADAVVEGSVSSTIPSKPLVLLAILLLPPPPPTLLLLLVASISTGGNSLGDSVPSSKMQYGGWLGICVILQCSRLESSSELLVENVTLLSGAGGGGDVSCCGCCGGAGHCRAVCRC